MNLTIQSIISKKILSVAAKGEVAVNLLQQGIEDVRKKFN